MRGVLIVRSSGVKPVNTCSELGAIRGERNTDIWSK